MSVSNKGKWNMKCKLRTIAGSLLVVLALGGCGFAEGEESAEEFSVKATPIYESEAESGSEAGGETAASGESKAKDESEATDESEASGETKETAETEGTDAAEESSQAAEESQSSEASAETQGSESEPTQSPALPADGVRMVSNVPRVVNPGVTFTGRAPLEPIEYAVTDPDNSRKLSTEKYSHSYGVAKDGAPHSITVNNQALFDSYGTGALAWDNVTQEKVLYLTFDCGYEYENLTSVILDTLADKQVTAAFFCTLDYLEDAPEIAARMINEGHTVGNHSTTHPSDSSLLTREKLAWELLGVHNYLRVNFGYESQYFRFPTGTCSQNALDLVNSIGYKSIFWSIAHADWDPANQPGVEKSFQTVISRLHPGSVILLHATSPDNAAILGDFIDYAHSQGYSFRALSEYPWNG